MQLLKFCLLRQVQLKAAGTGKRPLWGSRPDVGVVAVMWACYTHRPTNENIFAQFIVGFRSDARMGPKWGTSARRVLSEWEVREVPEKVLVMVPVPVLGKSADCWRRGTWTTIKWSHVSPIEAHGSFICLIAKLPNWGIEIEMETEIEVSAERAFIILTWIMISFDLFTRQGETRCVDLLSNQIIWSSREHQWGS